jgi:hypothetical protein
LSQLDGRWYMARLSTLRWQVQPEARVDADKQGLLLHPSPPTFPKAEAKRFGIT